MFSTTSSFGSALVYLVLASSTFAAPIAPTTPTPSATNVTRTLPYNVDQPASTPTYYQVPLPTKFLNQTSLAKIIGATSGSATFSKTLSKRQTTISTDTAPVNCLDGSHTDEDINTLFSYGGKNTTIYLCPGATINLLLPIQLTAESQTLTTLGSPTDSTRAILKVMGPYQTAAIIGSCSSCSYSTLSYVQFDGSRPLFGQWTLFQSALVEMGGNAIGQKVDHITAYG